MLDRFAKAKQVWAKYFAHTKHRHACALLFAVFFAMSVQAGNELPAPTIAEQGQTPTPTKPAKKPLEPAAEPSVVAVAPMNPTQAAPNKPELPRVDKPRVDRPVAESPIGGNPSAALADLPASKRLAISILAGVFTLIAALWIGARRD